MLLYCCRDFSGDYGFAVEVPAKEKITKSMSWIVSTAPGL